MKTFLFILIGMASSFMAGRTYERWQQQPIIAERVAEAHRTAATPAPEPAAWMHDPDRRTVLDDPAKPTTWHTRH